MSRRVLFEPEASAELAEAARWYEAQRSGLGLAFLAAVDGAVEHLAAWPDSGAAVPGVPVSLSVRQLPSPASPTGSHTWSPPRSCGSSRLRTPVDVLATGDRARSRDCGRGPSHGVERIVLRYVVGPDRSPIAMQEPLVRERQ